MHYPFNYYYVIPMPLNNKDEGPEMDSSKVCKIVYEIWNQDYEVVFTYMTEVEALQECLNLNASACSV